MSDPEWPAKVASLTETARKTRWMSLLESLLALGWFAMIVVGALNVLATVVLLLPRSDLTMWTMGIGPAWTVGRHGVPVDDVLAPGVSATGLGVEVWIDHAGSARVAAAMLYGLTWLPGILAAVLALWWLFRTVHRCRTGVDELFSPATVRGLRKAGWTLVIGSAAAYVMANVGLGLLSRMLLADKHFVPDEFPATMLVSGVATVAVSEVIQRGMELLDDVRRTI